LRTAAEFRQARNFAVGHARNLPDVRADLLQNRLHQPAAFAEQGREQMQRPDLRVAVIRRPMLRRLHRLLRFDGEFIETKCHVCSPS